MGYCSVAKTKLKAAAVNACQNMGSSHFNIKTSPIDLEPLKIVCYV